MASGNETLDSSSNSLKDVGPWGFIPSFNSLQLDIVGFLAILGEGSVLANAQVATLSKTCLLPRLLPAPQAMLRPTRPSKLDTSVGRVTSVFSGNDRDWVQHVGNVML